MLIFLAPVLGIVARSELYLYLPTFGCCLLTAALVAPWLERVTPTRLTGALAIACIAALASYQMTRSAALHADLVFSGRLVEALARSPALRGHRGPVVLVGATAEARQFLADAVGGYLPLVARRALGPEAFRAAAPVLRFGCAYEEQRVRLEPLQP
jgi:hypothetical protein